MNIFISKISFVIIFFGLVGISIWLGIKLFFILIPFIIAYFLSKPLYTLVTRIRKRIPLPHGILTFVVVFIILGALIALISYGAYRTVLALSGFSGHIQSVMENINTLFDSLNDYGLKLPWMAQPILLGDRVESFYSAVFTGLDALANNAVKFLLNILKALPSIGLFFLFLFLSLYFFIKDHDAVIAFKERLKARFSKQHMHLVHENVTRVVKDYIKAQLRLMGITFLISVVALFILRVPYAPLVALGIAFVDAIPLIGPAFVYMPWIVLTVLFGNYGLALGLFFAYAVTTLTRQVLEPKIVSTKIGTHPLITLTTIYVCYKIFGVVGFFVGVFLIILGLITLRVYTALKVPFQEDANAPHL